MPGCICPPAVCVLFFCLPPDSHRDERAATRRPVFSLFFSFGSLLGLLHGGDMHVLDFGLEALIGLGLSEPGV